MTAADIFLTSMTERTLRHIADVHTPAFTSVRRMRNLPMPSCGVCRSVRPSVCRVRVLHRNEQTYSQTFSTYW